jgi:butyrate kinase
MSFIILAINPGSTSTKVSVFKDQVELCHRTVDHTSAELAGFTRVAGQKNFRLRIIRLFLRDHQVDPRDLSAVVGRGGLLKPMAGGTYPVTRAMLRDLTTERYGKHASNLGGVLAWQIARQAGCRAFIVDPVVVDELDELARFSGLPELERKSIFHALNQKSTAREVAGQIGRNYKNCNFIVAHLGGGISVGAHLRGRVVDVNNALDGDGPFAPERSGGLPVGQLVELCYSGRHTLAEMKRKITGQGGLVAYCGSNRFTDLKAGMTQGRPRARLLFRALAYQVSQEIAKHGATLQGQVDRIILTGGLAHDRTLVAAIRARVRFLAPVVVVPGEREMLSLVRGALAVLQGKEKAEKYA